MEWLLSPIDASRAHAVGWNLSWHARLMVVAWGVLVPTGVMAARFFKVLPRQRFPEVVDNRAWWRAHLTMQIGGLILTWVGLWLVLTRTDPGASSTASAWTHRALGWTVVSYGLMQMMSGAFRGSKGGPSDRSLRGDHYDMTPRRMGFEALHKTVGYTALGLSMAAVLTGLWQANAPVWMWLTLTVWWSLLAVMFYVFQSRGMVIDTYVAIWGPDAAHPGNRARMPPPPPMEADRGAASPRTPGGGHHGPRST